MEMSAFSSTSKCDVYTSTQKFGLSKNNTFIQQGCIELSLNNAVLLNFYSLNNAKNVSVSTKTGFNTDKKNILSSKSAY